MITAPTGTHRRLNILTGEWVLVSPHRTQRPWQGQVEKTAPAGLPAYDPQCYLCPGNERAGGHRNPAYEGSFVFENDFAALRPESSGGNVNSEGLLIAQAETGICKVVCYSPRHDLTLAKMDSLAIRGVIDTWIELYREIGARDGIGYVQLFENRGEMMGCSNPHPHGQVWATSSVPNEPAKESMSQRAYREYKGGCLLCDYLKLEAAGERMVVQNDHFVALVPFWATWPFETLVLPRRHAAQMTEIPDAERDGLADILRRLTRCYDNLFQVSFPYSMGFHCAPVGGDYPEWHYHAHFYPPLLRSATVKKFMVGFEMLGSPQRDITPEAAAQRLRDCLDAPNSWTGETACPTIDRT